jgi:8-oxo-dGTP pyrophosphatase MutT (NUDIX family)
VSCRLEDLREERDLAAAQALLASYRPTDARQIEARERMLAWIERFPLDAHQRTRLEGHLTASALVVNHERTHALLTHHKKLGRWLQLGGHCDGDANLARAALREAIEESGIADLAIDPAVVDLDIHAIPARGSEPEHLHLDVRFVVHAPAGARAVISDESHALAWIAPADLDGILTDESVKRLFRHVFANVV